VRNDVPIRWRGVWEDTDYSLQALALGWCTLLFQVYVIEKAKSGSIAGGHTELYAGDGRLKRLRWLERTWPGCFRIQRAYGEPRIRPRPGLYRSFTQRPILREGV
ncbi:MAG: hypothetical protein L0191_06885, partial [Acidobacteria bacterium]|nr:hypothetical protein [Acidobacteriota bacterium]